MGLRGEMDSLREGDIQRQLLKSIVQSFCCSADSLDCALLLQAFLNERCSEGRFRRWTMKGVRDRRWGTRKDELGGGCC